MTDQLETRYERLHDEAETAGYHLNPDREHTLGLVEGLIKNETRYGYSACPCRLAEGDKAENLDIICPCDYRDADLTEHGTCYCGLYVSQAVLDGKASISSSSIPERRPEKEKREGAQPGKSDTVGVIVWRCRVCGYLCAREKPPEVCPICKAKKDRFEQFDL